MSTLMDLRYRRKLVAKNGENGRGSDMYGKGADDLVVAVPVGTQVFDADSGEQLADLDEPGKRIVIAKGGRGGRGNIHFKTPQDRAPRRSEPGEEGEAKKLRMELKLLADVGLLGYPNVGKSTLISVISRARPKIADYPFTTIVPNLGVASIDERSFVVADIPGLIEGAAEGAGLGTRFLKHVERTRALLHIVTVDPDPERTPLRDFDVLMAELERFDPVLATRPMVVAISKIDLPEVRRRVITIKRGLKARGYARVYPFSAATGEGVDALQRALVALLDANPIKPAPRAVPMGPRVGSRDRTGYEQDAAMDVEYVE
jgi:GTPase